MRKKTSNSFNPLGKSETKGFNPDMTFKDFRLPLLLGAAGISVVAFMYVARNYYDDTQTNAPSSAISVETVSPQMR